MDNVLSGNRLSTAHQNIARGKFTHDFTPKVAAKLWKELTVILNSCFGGPTKGWKEWRKTWQDIKASAKVKFGPLVRLQEGEADPSFQYTLNDFQKRVLAILRMNLTSGQGETTDPVLLFNGMRTKEDRRMLELCARNKMKVTNDWYKKEREYSLDGDTDQ
uniref:Regulatory protein zeste n=1 Tax=Timema poppense TaxID=170557 RepID=A0A7R9DSZ9_TIMPO|nr:unnamed protein product [Timema poppensis]